MNHAPADRLILLTGGTGYVGGRLLAELERDGWALRCLARSPEHLRPRVGRATEVVGGDLMDAPSLEAAMRGVDVAFYLAHALGSGRDFEQREQQAAGNFADAAKRAGVGRIIYLGGLGEQPESSPHLRSRRRVGEILRDSGVPTIEFRASVIIGSGSLSFELIRALARKLPVMTVPRWGSTLTQPIAIEDVIAYLIEAIDLPLDGSRVYEIGSPDQVSYIDLLREYAQQRGLRRVLVSVPVITPRLSSLWLGLVTPVYARVGRKLIDSTQTRMLVTDDRALRDFAVRPRTVSDAIARALVNEDEQFARTRWNDALSATKAPRQYGGQTYGSRLVDTRCVDVAAGAAEAFAPIRGIGGKRGWYFADVLWSLRGWLDTLVGGVGLRRGRRDADHVRVGDTIDFWRVEAFEADRLLRLAAEMKLPGRAWLQFEVEPRRDGGSRIRQTALFDPAGLAGLVYWYALWPLHEVIFAGMIRRIAAEAQQRAGS